MSTILDLQVGAGADDSRWYFGVPPTWGNTSAIYGAGSGGGTVYYHSEARFTSVSIAQGSTIDAAYITLTASQNQSSSAVKSLLSSENSDNATQITSYADFISRAKTSTVAWDGLAGWTTDTAYNSPSLITPIQTVISRASWVSNNALRVFWDDNTSDSGAVRFGYSYDASTTKTTKLHIEYTAAGGGGISRPVAVYHQRHHNKAM
jgi:hypothetical protein